MTTAVERTNEDARKRKRIAVKTIAVARRNDEDGKNRPPTAMIKHGNIINTLADPKNAITRGSSFLEETMKFEDYWLDDQELSRISRRVPSTEFGTIAMEEVWPKKFTDLGPSEGYRGMAIVHSMLLACMNSSMGFDQLDRMIEKVDDSLKASKSLQSHANRWLRGGAVLEMANAWETLRSGLSTDEFLELLNQSKFIHAKCS